MPGKALILTGEQIRAARALARIEQTALAEAAGLSLETIKRLERIRGPVVDANVRTLNALYEAFGALGIVFESEAGTLVVRMSFPGLHAVEGSRRLAAEQAASSLHHRVLFHSTWAGAEGSARLREDLSVWRRKNQSAGVTGALIASGGRMLQALEGPREAVRAIYGAISFDARHSGVRLMQSASAAARLFSDPLGGGYFPGGHELFAGDPAMAAGFQPEALSPAAALGLLGLATQLAQMPLEAI